MEKNERKKLGDLGERLALARLETLGYHIVETNWRCEIGELDIVAWHGQCLVFIEVRTRRGGQAGSPEDSVTRTKQTRLLQLSQVYLQTHPAFSDSRGEWPSCRIDLAAVEFDAAGRLIRLQVRPNIVESS